MSGPDALVLLVVLVLFAAAIAVLTRALAWERRQMAELARRLGGTLEGELPGLVAAASSVLIRGRLEGHDVRVRLGRGPDGPRWALEVDVPHAPCDLRVSVADATAELARFLCGAQEDRVRGLTVLAPDGAAARLLLHEETGEVLAALAARGRSVDVRSGKLTFERPANLVGADTLMADLGLLVRAATTMQRAPVTAPGAARFVWTGGGGARCPFCRDDLDADAADVIACEACATLHHRECLEQAHGCTVFGCRGGPVRVPAG